MLSSTPLSFGTSGPSPTKRKCSSDELDPSYLKPESLAKRRRTPANSEAEHVMTAPIAIPSIHQYGEHHYPMIHHPLPYQPMQTPLYQLNTPPVETYEGYNYPVPISRPDSVQFDDENDMMIDDGVSLSQNEPCSSSQQQPWMNPDPTPQSKLSLAINYTPPSPITPLAKQQTHGAFNSTIEPETVCENQEFHDPIAGIWKRRSRNAKKNFDGEVIGYKMGFLADCEKCQMKIPGHSGHFIRKPHSV